MKTLRILQTPGGDDGQGTVPPSAFHVDEHEHHDPAPTVQLGFWIYLMSDCILFAGLFATFAVLSQNFAGGPTGRELFDLPYVAVETALLLLSSLSYGAAMLAVNAGRRGAVMFWLAVTFLLGLAFIGMELNEFHHMIAEGAGPDRSGFLSAFFTLVGTHGLHVTSGLVWMAIMMVQLGLRGLNPTTNRRLMCLSLFWHFLDIVWIGVFSFVYLLGAAA
ncbi:cytochrome o ubiquinol oxidase subunit III [Sphingomonas oleivorans]|uniref:Cytochrome bo(3) ubiquinol oxidase subunit 3 n=1 Tax=Sphingomonas oleivorans TaxID=1735121 RepID=A0A2T5G381_9SPHN|nr:cytochrome o ubiquinol oxidase subunit III [Sphingomonas oleivorans]PTQ13596.1 cytochrome o ubiquinol oxidase subunit III [Sphingomonas oleivorans]